MLSARLPNYIARLPAELRLHITCLTPDVCHVTARTRQVHTPHIYCSVATRSAFRLGRKLTSMGFEWGMQMQIVDPPQLPPRHPAPRLEVPPFPTPASDCECALPIPHKMSHNTSQLGTSRAEQSAPTPPAMSLHLPRACKRPTISHVLASHVECSRADRANHKADASNQGGRNRVPVLRPMYVHPE
ncbi:hypothetical protein B0H10DRAFT_2211208 [Mycena sp. CBHHK59/15]|nr:hypothetical protein B0H10DRAFT_2211208 [Mycena sp. CBHHK59/15]